MAAADTGETKSTYKEPSSFKNFIAGGVGGIAVVIIGHPFDTVKVRLQTQIAPEPGEKPQFTSTYDCFRKTVKYEGFRGLYKGVLAPLVGVTPLFALSFSGYGLGKQLQMKTPNQELNVYQHVLAGGFSGILTTTVAAPGERIKCLMQIQTLSGADAKYSSSVDCAVKLYKEGGIRSVYKGTIATLLREIPGGGAYFGTYYWLVNSLRSAGTDRGELSISRTLFAGGMAGIMNWLVMLPMDVAKSRYQIAPAGQYGGLYAVYAELIREGGIRSLYKGFTPVFLRAFPANAGAFLGFELTIKFLNWLLPE